MYESPASHVAPGEKRVSSLIKLAHPYRSIPEGIQRLGQSLDSTPRRGVTEAIRWLRLAVDQGGAESLRRADLAELIRVVAETRKALVERYRPLEAHMNWFSAGIGSIGVITLVKQLPFVWVIAPLAALAMIMSRVAYSEARRWLDVAEEAEKLESDLRSIAKTLEPAKEAGPILQQFLAPGLGRTLLLPSSIQTEVSTAAAVDTQREHVLPVPTRSSKQGRPQGKKKKRR
jgi:hypothetical protein